MQQQYLWNITLERAFSWCNIWVDRRHLDCLPLGGKSLWDRNIVNPLYLLQSCPKPSYTIVAVQWAYIMDNFILPTLCLSFCRVSISTKMKYAQLIKVTVSLSVETSKAFKLSTLSSLKTRKAIRLEWGAHQVHCDTVCGGIEKSNNHISGWHRHCAFYTSNIICNDEIKASLVDSDSPFQRASNIELWLCLCC